MSATQSGLLVTTRAGREPGHGVGPDDGARHVVGVMLEAVERYFLHEALPRVPMTPYVRSCAPAAMTVCL